MWKRIYLSNLVLALMLSATVLGQMANPTNPPDEARPIAPPFSLISLEGEKFELAALRGKVVVLNFWFTGCAPCVAEFRKLNGLVNKYKNKKVVFIAPTLDNVTTLKLFLKEHRFKYHIVPNASRLIVSTYSDGSGNVVFPTHIVINKEGEIDTRVTGAERIGDLLKAIARLADVEIEKAK
ncbi:MAG TPA: TlpA disulfide reductase family protein [Pyrinomonadaceae bacterium]|nr:TlpA disulfide reductase family protein [Pyrinomonadaceae bacterium]